MPDERGPWKLLEFEQRLDGWIERESPSQDLVLVVVNWILSRADDPYEGARREPGFANLWSVRIRNTAEGPRTGFTVVLCSYFINEEKHQVEADNFATLSYPV
ncbi:hypothetical protein GCM10022225_05410 [Plantactinospora mayteni]|uniref:Uncharacterized protein n=1 Tax=Plantactinospora mayteni TaxID=566021 RepID=A0ABQ4EQU3_9ACTN|nr:hypothetical protein [Plantactinospora mayteni]GIG97030.1 hypothetical protein Pma05_36030 [Plantactinospora mayteni]